MKENKRFKQILLLFKIAYLLYLLLAFNAFVNGTMWMNVATYGITFWGLGLISWMAVQFKRYQNGYNLWILAAFAVSYGISACTQLSFGIGENAKGMIWLVIPFALLYLASFDLTGAQIKKELTVLSGIYVLYITVMSILSMTMVYWGRKYDYIDSSGVIHAIGYRWNRLWGVYDDPNHGATITMIGLLMLVFFTLQTKKIWLRILLGIAFLLNYLYLVFSDSRTGLLSLMAGIVIGAALYGWQCMKNKGSRKKASIVFLCALFAAGALFVGDIGIKQAYKPLDQAIVRALTEQGRMDSHTDSGSAGRKQDITKDYSNGRMNILSGGLSIVKQSPLLGVGYRNIAAYAKANFPDSYLVKNPGNVSYDSMHNLEMDVLVSQGGLGILLFLLLLANTCRLLFGKIHLVPAEYKREVLFSAAVAGTLFVAGTFLSFIFYVNAPQNFCFWLFLGYAMRFCQFSDKEKA